MHLLHPLCSNSPAESENLLGRTSYATKFPLYISKIKIFRRMFNFRLQKSDGLTCFAWVFVLFVHNQPIYHLLPKQDVLLLCPLLSLAVTVLTIVSTACRRYTFMRSFRGKLIWKQSRPSPAGKLRYE